MMSERDNGGRFKKGVSGNPGGRPKANADVIAAARAHTTKAIETLASLMVNADTDATKVSAARALLERGWGAPVQSIETKTSLADELEAVKKRDAAFEATRGSVVALFPPPDDDDDK
jgi:hypothetical protein